MDAKAAARAVAEEIDCDVVLFNDDIDEKTYVDLVQLVESRRTGRRPGILLQLITYGGDPHAAYRIGRFLQTTYDEFNVLIAGPCKSAGTLLAIGAHNIYFSGHGHLGPLDIQRMKYDELKLQSGLVLDDAFQALQVISQRMASTMIEILREDSSLNIRYRTAARIASEVVPRLLAPVYRQIDPARIGEDWRAIEVTRHYGERLNMVSKSLADETVLTALIHAYPDHGTVIDKREASVLLTTVRSLTDKQKQLVDLQSGGPLDPDLGAGCIAWLSP